MEAKDKKFKDEKFKIEVWVAKNVHVPEYGPEAYYIESHSVYIPYGKKFKFKSSNDAISFVKSKLTGDVLNVYDRVSIIKWRGYGGTSECLKDIKEKNDTTPVNKDLAENILSY